MACSVTKSESIKARERNLVGEAACSHECKKIPYLKMVVDKKKDFTGKIKKCKDARGSGGKEVLEDPTPEPKSGRWRNMKIPAAPKAATGDENVEAAAEYKEVIDTREYLGSK
ncbi:hypothetical protein EMCG_07084 [[Emmonsia] crescens]|uniref:Uncharacterized protein n=1 Tax=[Emmonsia] crescens TaxID=73230 RepID=A0A0G2I9K1_9EURO|nr:hypothetical protein EMCG_07084 [Emmonsia crescens UAMH 3008]